MEKFDIEKQLPFGVDLRDILHHPSITAAVQRKLLRMRGVFVEGNEKSTVPLLISTLLSAAEFELIKEKVRAREAGEKLLTRTIEWHSELPLLNAIPVGLDIHEIIQASFPRAKLVSATPFTRVNDSADHLKMEFRCQTNNYNASWYRTTDEFVGKVELEKVKSGDEVHMRMKYTSEETKKVADRIGGRIEKSFKEKGFTKAPEMERVLYGNFNNQQRVQFFLGFLSGNNVFTFKRSTFIDFGPDPDADLPKNFAWLNESKIRQLNLKGEELHKSPFVKEKENHMFIEMASMEAWFDFKYHAAEGNCKMRFGFDCPNGKRQEKAEFSSDVLTVNLASEYHHVHKDSVQNYLLVEFDKLKLEIYRSYKHKKLAENYTPGFEP